MSGRDYKSFVSSHRDRAPDGMSKNVLIRVRDGIGSNLYKQVDYEQLKTLAAEKKFAANKSLIKVKKIEEASKQSKEHNLLKQHKKVWQKEFLRLNSQRRRMQVEIEAFIRQNTDYEAPIPEAFEMYEDYESNLVSDFSQFKEDTADPIWTLREDLKYWLLESQGARKPVESQGSPAEVLQTVHSVKEQQNQILEKLYNEQLSLERELQHDVLTDIVTPSERKVQEGIPQEAFNLECPDADLKASVLKEFILLDEQHRERLHIMEDKHAAALSAKNGGWSDSEHFRFQVIQEQYSYDLTNRRALFIDRLKRHLPHKTRQQIVEHEDWCLLYKYYHERKKDIVNDWIRDRKELLNKAKAIFGEMCMALELEEAKSEFRKKQNALCEILYDKVKIWREQKVEAMLIEQQLEDRRQQEEEEKRKIEEEKEKKRRAYDKQKIKTHQEDIEHNRQEVEEKNRKRLEELTKILAEQAAYDNERVKFREEQVKKKMEEKRLMEEQKLIEEEEKERRLETLREQVRVVAESDPDRLLHDTESWQARKQNEEEVYIQKPLFQVNSFTAHQVTSDPRVRLENKLREAGLHNTDYARHMLSQIKPPQQPRRDMESTVFKK